MTLSDFAHRLFDMNKTIRLANFLLILVLIASSTALAGGYEKTMLFSGRQAAMGGVGATLQGSQALYFNPAGLTKHNKEKAEISGQFSPSWIQFGGPVARDHQFLNSDTQFLPIFGGFASYQATPQLAFGVGAFVSGGSKVVYKNVDFSSATVPVTGTALSFPTFRPDIKSELSVAEYSIGAAYEVSPGFRVGAAWRIVQGNGSISTASFLQPPTVPTAVSLVNAIMDNLSDTEYNGFRLGAQYDEKTWGFGVGYRSNVDFVLSGTSKGKKQVVTSSTISEFTGSTANAATSFPAQFQLGGHVRLLSDQSLELFGEWSFTQYHSKAKKLKFSGYLYDTTTIDLDNFSVKQDWKNLNVFRFGTEYLGIKDYALRAGYAYTGQVTSAHWAQPTFMPAGYANSFTVGIGRYCLNHTLDLDLGFEYSIAKATVTPGDAGGALVTRPGEYQAKAVVVHSGVTYRF